MQRSGSPLQILACSGLALLLGHARAHAVTQAPDSLEKIARPFFNEHCTKCHGEKKQKGDLRVDDLIVNFDSPKIMGHWEEIMNRINSGDMPPDDVDKRPKAEDIARVAEWIAGQLREADSARQSSSGEKVAFRKLTREEYANSVRDLLGVSFDVTDPTGLPEDPDWHGIQRIGSVLTLSATHVEKYLAAADAILSEALGLGPAPKRELTHWSAFDLRGGGWKGLEKEYERRGIADKVRMDVVPNNGALDDRGIRIKTAGDYLVRVKLSGLRPAGGRPPRLRLYAADISRTLFEQDVDAPESQPITLEFRVHLPAGDHPVHIVNSVPGPNPEARRSRPGPNSIAFTGLDSRIPWQMKFTDDDGKPILPFLLIDWIEWDGPIVDSWPTAAYQRIFFGGEHATKDSAYAREILTRFAERAWRRPVGNSEIDRYVQLSEKAQQFGDDFDHSIKTALSAILCAKSFLYIVEGNAGPTVAGAGKSADACDCEKPAAVTLAKADAASLVAPPQPAVAPSSLPRPTAAKILTDWELASRLSYFLWSTIPDQRLLDLARTGKLHERETLRAETHRMLADPKAEEFVSSFARQWLQLRRVGMFPPDKVLYPEYDESLEKSMINETVDFFGDVLKRDASLREFLDSNWTMLNERLAKFYGVEGVEGDQFRRVALKPEDHRGGLLTQAAVLSLTSDGTRHRPVHRGVWILESIVGKPAPVPPANVPALSTPDANSRKTTVRQKLEAHRSDPNCNACHRRIDPLGIAFDNYDAIGHWRTVETVHAGTGDDPTLDPSGELYDGRTFADAQGLKKLLMDDLDKFAMAFTEKLAAYALRRGTLFSDRQELKKVTDHAKGNGYKLSSLIEDFVTSDLFQKR